MQAESAGEQVKGSSVSQTDLAEGLVPIDPDLIPLDSKLDFPLFLQVGENGGHKFILLKNRGTTFSERVRSRIRQDGSPIFTKQKHFQAYQSSVDAHLEGFLTDESVPIEKRASILYQKGEDVMEAFFDRPDSKENCAKAQKMVSHIVRLAHTNKNGPRSMMMLARQDYTTYTHSLHVCIMGVGFLQRILSDPQLLRENPIGDDLEKLGQGFIYHDLGKSLIDARILKKSGPLNAAEWETIKKHPSDGVRMIEEMGIRDPDILNITLYHHERMDGTGYPHGLKGDKIPVISRIAAIIDGFDAISSNRPYKPAESTFRALSVMKDENAGFYDPALFEKFIPMFNWKSE